MQQNDGGEHEPREPGGAGSLGERARSGAKAQTESTAKLHVELTGKATGTAQTNRKRTGLTEEVIMPIGCF